MSWVNRLLPAGLHRALMPLAYALRSQWRELRGTPFAGVSVVITNLAGNVLLIRHSYGPKVWALPGGGIEAGEDPEIAARREVEEELGLKLASLEPLGPLEEDLYSSPHTAFVFTAVIDAQPRPDGREVIEARFFPSHSLPEPMGKLTRKRIEHWRSRKAGPAA